MPTINMSLASSPSPSPSTSSIVAPQSNRVNSDKRPRRVVESGDMTDAMNDDDTTQARLGNLVLETGGDHDTAVIVPLSPSSSSSSSSSSSTGACPSSSSSDLNTNRLLPYTTNNNNDSSNLQVSPIHSLASLHEYASNSNSSIPYSYSIQEYRSNEYDEYDDDDDNNNWDSRTRVSSSGRNGSQARAPPQQLPLPPHPRSRKSSTRSCAQLVEPMTSLPISPNRPRAWSNSIEMDSEPLAPHPMSTMMIDSNTTCSYIDDSTPFHSHNLTFPRAQTSPTLSPPHTTNSSLWTRRKQSASSTPSTTPRASISTCEPPSPFRL